jgi:hypothetical protein
MIDLLLRDGRDAGRDADLLRQLDEHIETVRRSAGQGNADQVRRIEEAVEADPTGAFTFDTRGSATLHAGGATFSAGRFETMSLGALREAVHAQRERTGAGPQTVRLWVLHGASPATDIGALQATAGPGTLFQVASQFNCLEAPGPYVTPVARYFSDPTQGPRASISAFPGTLLRHYAAPAPDGTRFTQRSDGRQLNLLEAFEPDGPNLVRNGYLTAHAIDDPAALAGLFSDQWEDIRVGVHDDVEVVLGYDWDGAAAGLGAGRIGQVFTSTFAGGGYSGLYRDDETYHDVCRHLLRAAYLGTLRAAVVLGRPKVVLTLIGGGVFGNPIPIIWESILWALAEVERETPLALDVFVNLWSPGASLAVDKILPDVRARSGAILLFSSWSADTPLEICR